MPLQIDKNGIWRDESTLSISYPDSGNEFCFGIEENSFWFQHRNQVILSTMKRFPYQGNFADIGGGNGFQISFLQKHFPGRQFFLIEPGYEGCLNSRKRGVDHVYNIEFQKFNFKQAQVGAVGLFDVLEHIEDAAGFLKELKASLGPGKRIFITTPAYNWLWSASDDHGGHCKRYILKDFEKLAMICDLKVVYSSYFFSFLPLPTFLIRALPYRLGVRRKWIKKTASKEHQPTRWVKSIIQPFQTREINILSNSRMKFGASCITVYET